MDHQDTRRKDHKRDRRQVLDRIVWQLSVQARIDGNGGTGHHQRVTVRRGLCGTIDRNIAASAGRILDQDGPAPGVGKLVCKQPRRDVRGTAWRKTDENSNGFIRIGGLSKPVVRSEQRRQRGKESAYELHSHFLAPCSYRDEGRVIGRTSRIYAASAAQKFWA